MDGQPGVMEEDGQEEEEEAIKPRRRTTWGRAREPGQAGAEPSSALRSNRRRPPVAAQHSLYSTAAA